MVTVEEAKKLVISGTSSLSIIDVEVVESLGFVTASDVHSKINYPPFNQADKDGYAFSFNDLSNPGNIRVIGEVAAGKKPSYVLAAKEAVRIFTGAPVPDGADTVVMQENAVAEMDNLVIRDSLLKKGDNFRGKGAQFKAGEVVVYAGTLVTPGCIACIVGAGIDSIKVYRKPVVSIIITGNELQQPGNELKEGQVYDTNTYTLQAALKSIGIVEIYAYKIGDNLDEITKCIKFTMENSDMVLVAGGISVGDYDYVSNSFNQLEVERIFYKVKQKPGKPLFFGKKGDTLIFGLPGNPSSALNCFYEYVMPGILKQCGRQDVFPETNFLPISSGYQKKMAMAVYLRAIIQDGKVVPLNGQESYKTQSFAFAECLIYLPEGKANVEKGELVEVHKIPTT